MPEKKPLQDLAKIIADHQANLTKLSEAWGQKIVDHLDDVDRKTIAQLKTLLEDVKANYKVNTAKSLTQLEYIRKKLEKIRTKAFVAAEKELRKEAPDLIDNETKWSKKLLSELTGEKASTFADLTDGQAQKLLKSSVLIDKPWDAWWTNTAYGDVMRIANVVNAGVVQGLTIDEMVQQIMGTKARNYTDGVLSTNRAHARNLARTLCGGISNQAKDQFYRNNDDVVIGVEWLDTLDGRTCPQCAGMSRNRWKTNDPHPVPPRHPSCRCVLIPVTELTDMGEDVPRAAANADFMALAKEEYEKKYPGKKWENLSESTRKSKYYKAMQDYEDRTGKPAYSQVPGNMKFKDYFLQMDEKQKSSWLGKRKYAMWKDGLVDLNKFIPPYPDRAYTVKELKTMDKESFNLAGSVKSKNSKKGSSLVTEKPVSKHKKHRLKQIERAKRNRAEREAKMIGAKMIEGKHSRKDDLLAVNPNYNAGRNGIWENNCQRCVVAYELRRRGIDVRAMPCFEDIKAESKIKDNWKILNGNAKWDFRTSADINKRKDYVIKQMKEWGEGCRASIYVDYGNGKAHVFSAELVNGKVMFVDPQTGEFGTDKYFSMQKSPLFGIARVDNLKINDYINGVVEVNK